MIIFVVQNIIKIVLARGTVVPGLGTRRGRRKDLGLPSLPRGGHMMKKTDYEKKWVHADAEECRKEMIKKSEKQAASQSN